MARVTCSLQFVLVLAAALLTLSAVRAETGALNDPVAYCQAAGTLDAPDAKLARRCLIGW